MVRVPVMFRSAKLVGLCGFRVKEFEDPGPDTRDKTDVSVPEASAVATRDTYSPRVADDGETARAVPSPLDTR